MRKITELIRRVKLVYGVLNGKSIVISEVGNIVEVNAGKKSREEVQNIATVFFKEAYNLLN